jgi:hypothetical protein
MWLAIALAAIVLALIATGAAVVALVVATYSAAKISVAHQKSCDTYKIETRSVEIDTNGGASALDAKDRDAARALAAAYRNADALGGVATDAEYRTALDEIVAKDAATRQRCGNGGG